MIWDWNFWVKMEKKLFLMVVNGMIAAVVGEIDTGFVVRIILKSL